jgi:predicted nucleotidyltransferase
MRKHIRSNKGVRRIDRNAVIEIATRFAKRVVDEMPVRKVTLFGSQVRGNARPDSDIDIAVVVDKLEGDFLDTTNLLHSLSRAVDDRIEPVLILEGKDPSGFYAEIQRTGENIYTDDSSTSIIEKCNPQDR